MNREVADVRDALSRTEVAVGVEKDGQLVAAVRFLIDCVYYANAFDVIVAAARSREGIGERLVDAVVAHPDFRKVIRLSLLCHRCLVPYLVSVG